MTARRNSSAVRLAVRVYRAASVVLPREFRAEYGDELAECFARIASDARARRGRLALVAATVRSIVDLAARAAGRHLTAARAAVSAVGAGAGWTGAWGDVRHAARRLRRQPGFTVPAVLTLALGIAAAASIFSLVHGVVLSPLPYPDSERIVQVDHAGRGIGVDRGLGITYGFYRVYAERLRTVESIAMYGPIQQTLTGAGDPVRLQGVSATPSLADVLRVPPRLGRWFTAAEGQPGAPLTVVLSHRLWRERLGADPAVVGRTIELSGVAREVVGVMPAAFAFPSPDVAFWIPQAVPPTGVGGWNHRAVARLEPGADEAALEREIVSLFPVIRETGGDPARVSMYLDDAGIVPRIVSRKESVVGDVRPTLWILLGTVGFLLIIAVANVANLFLVRAEEGERETALRAALGAGSGRLVRGFLSETMLLALAASALGIGAAAAAIRVVRTRAPVNIPRLHEVGVDPTVLGVALGTAVAVALLLGLIPALRRRGDPGEALREGGRRSTASRSRLRGRNVLVATQIALALVLLIGSGLLFRTFRELRSVDLGFGERQALVFELGLPRTLYPAPADAQAFHSALVDRLRALPGVESAAAVAPCLPLSGDMCWGETLEAEGRPVPEGTVAPVTGTRVATTDYFRTLGIPVHGRVFAPADETADAPVAILSEAAAEAYFGSDDPIGRNVRFGSNSPWYRVVGVAGNVRGRVETDEFQRVIYLPTRREATAGPPPMEMTYAVATAVEPTSLVPAVRRIVAELDPALPLAEVGTLRGRIDRATAPTAFSLVLIGVAAAMALLLGAVGVYGVVAYAVSRRTAEIGVRMALGARGADVRLMVLRQGGAAVLAGSALGLVAAYFLTRLMAGMLYGVAPTDPASYILLTALMLVIAGAALLLPAMRAARVDPMEALRAE